ncbi:sulfatase family protein [Sphingobacterium haloxyli]|nr:sulfatase [Sphingobacterium haloxyli]
MNISNRTNNGLQSLLFVFMYLLHLQATFAQDYYNESRQNPKPNFLIIMADDLDVQQLSCYGGKNLDTKHIDRLASEGLKFNSMIASEAMCIPTRASLLTGLYPARHGAYQNHKPVNKGLKSIVHYLGGLGYRVGLTGKDHMTKPKTIFPFDIIDGFETNCVSPTDVYFLDSVRHYITQGSPYCLFIMSNNPHTPWTVGDPNEFNPSKLTLPAHWVDTEQSRTEFCKYLAEVRRLDNQVGDVLAMLEKTGQDKNTIVVFLGEQGPQFPGGKWSLYDYGQKSGMIVRWPERVNAKTETDAIVQYEDITPTLVDIAGGKAIGGLDGRSFKQVLTDPEKPHREVAFGIHNNIPEGPAYPIRSVRDNKYKLILNLLPEATYSIKWMMNDKNPTLVWPTWIAEAQHDEAAAKLTNRIAHKPAVEFYDLQNDPNELRNLAEDPAYKKLVTKYTNRLQNWMKEQGDSGIDMDTKF